MDTRITDGGSLAGKTCVVLGVDGMDVLGLVMALKRCGAIARGRTMVPIDEVCDEREIDPFDEEAMREAVRGADILFLLCLAGVTAFGYPAQYVWKRNVDCVRMACLAAEAEGVGRLVYCGSILSLGRQTSAAPVDASTPYQPDDARTALERSLFQGEMETWRAAERGLPVTVVLAGLPYEGVRNRLWLCLRRGMTTMPPMESAFIESGNLREALIDAADGAHIGERIVRAGRNASIATLAGEIAAHSRLSSKIKVLTDWQMRILLKMPRWIASRRLFEPGMGRMLMRRDRYA